MPLRLIEAIPEGNLWVYNAHHHAQLKAYVAAKLRERTANAGYRSMFSRLPSWIKAAKNREAVLKHLHRLEEQLLVGEFKCLPPTARFSFEVIGKTGLHARIHNLVSQPNNAQGASRKFQLACLPQAVHPHFCAMITKHSARAIPCIHFGRYPCFCEIIQC
jgi:hypothetical protein